MTEWLFTTGVRVPDVLPYGGPAAVAHVLAREGTARAPMPVTTQPAPSTRGQSSAEVHMATEFGPER